MSRGRGGGRGGRGGAGAGRGKIGGMDVSWEDDPEVLRAIQKEPTGMFPDIRIPISRPISRVEKTSIQRYRILRQRIHDGPLYTILDPSPRDGLRGPVKGTVGVMNPFEGLRTYSQKFQRKRYRMPKLDTRPYVLQFFPPELRITLDPTCIPNAEANGATGEDRGKRKRLDIFKATATSRLEELDAMDDDDLARKGDEEKDHDEEEEQEDQDDEFNSDDSDGGDDDYNAEQYFSGGEGGDDGMDDDDGGGDTYD